MTDTNSTISEELSKLIDKDETPVGTIGSPSDTFEVITDIRDISEETKLLGEVVYFLVKESNERILVSGQVTEIKTVNRWHEEPSFKGIIKRHGKLPNLSGIADNRVATVRVQSSFKLKLEGNPQAYQLANSPSTGEPVKKMTNDVMKKIMSDTKLKCIGNAYGTDLNIPFHFKHFGDSQDYGAGDAYHIGVFGMTGSGKTTTAANMILGYAQNKEHMSILILDPQGQFSQDNKVIPGRKFKDLLKEHMNLEEYKLSETILPRDDFLFSHLLLENGFIAKAFKITTDVKKEAMRELIQEFFERESSEKTFEKLLEYVINPENLGDVYTDKRSQKRVMDAAEKSLLKVNPIPKELWDKVFSLFDNDSNKTSLVKIVEDIVKTPGNTIILNLSEENLGDSDTLKALFVKTIEDLIKEKGAELYSNGKPANCLVVLDEAHRYISTGSYDQRMKDLTKSIVEAVRTTRKYGIGYMFITQTLESLHEEITKQIRIFAFGYGLISGGEFSKVKNIVNDDSGTKFYRSFIDPASNGKFPFMFYGPISPLSFTGSPIFVEMFTVIQDFHHSEQEKDAQTTLIGF